MDWHSALACAFLLIVIKQGEVIAFPGSEGMQLGGSLFGTAAANHVPRLGRRSYNPFGRLGASGLTGAHRQRFRFFGETGEGEGGGGGGVKRSDELLKQLLTGAPRRSNRMSPLAGFMGPLLGSNSAPRYQGDSMDQLTRGLLRDKKPFSLPDKDYYIPVNMENGDGGDDINDQQGVPLPQAPDSVRSTSEDPWKKVLDEATLNSILGKMARLEETQAVLDELEQYDRYASGSGNPLPKFLARFSSNRNKEEGEDGGTGNANDPGRIENRHAAYYDKISRYRPYPRRK